MLINGRHASSRVYVYIPSLCAHFKTRLRERAALAPLSRSFVVVRMDRAHLEAGIVGGRGRENSEAKRGPGEDSDAMPSGEPVGLSGYFSVTAPSSST